MSCKMIRLPSQGLFVIKYCTVLSRKADSSSDGIVRASVKKEETKEAPITSSSIDSLIKPCVKLLHIINTTTCIYE